MKKNFIEINPKQLIKKIEMFDINIKKEYDSKKGKKINFFMSKEIKIEFNNEEKISAETKSGRIYKNSSFPQGNFIISSISNWIFQRKWVISIQIYDLENNSIYLLAMLEKKIRLFKLTLPIKLKEEYILYKEKNETIILGDTNKQEIFMIHKNKIVKKASVGCRLREEPKSEWKELLNKKYNKIQYIKDSLLIKSRNLAGLNEIVFQEQVRYNSIYKISNSLKNEKEYYKI